MPRNYLKVRPEIMRAHRIRWYAVDPSVPFSDPGHLIPKHETMLWSNYGWDVKCSCGWESRTGGAIYSSVLRNVEDHRWDAQAVADYEKENTMNITWHPWPDDIEDAPGRCAEPEGWWLEVQPTEVGWHWEAAQPMVTGPGMESWTVTDEGEADTLEEAQAAAVAAAQDES